MSGRRLSGKAIKSTSQGTQTSGKRLSGKSLVRGKAIVRERSCPRNVLSGKCLSGKAIVRETCVTHTPNTLLPSSELYNL